MSRCAQRLTPGELNGRFNSGPSHYLRRQQIAPFPPPRSQIGSQSTFESGRVLFEGLRTIIAGGTVPGTSLLWGLIRAAASRQIASTQAGLRSVCKPYFPEVPITKRRQLNILMAQQGAELGERALQEIRNTPLLSTNGIFISQVDRVATNLAAAAQRPALKWDFVVVETNKVNACCAPGGKIIVNTRMLSFATNDNELAVVIGHGVGRSRFFRPNLVHGTHFGLIPRLTLRKARRGGGRASTNALGPAAHELLFLCRFTGLE